MPGWTGVAGVFKITLGLSTLPQMSLHMWSGANKPLAHTQTHSICRSSILLSERDLRLLGYTNVLCHAHVELDEHMVLFASSEQEVRATWLHLSDRHTVGMKNDSHSVKHVNLP